MSNALAAAHIGLVAYDAKDPATKFPPILQLRPPKGAPNVLSILIDDSGLAPPAPLAAPGPRKSPLDLLLFCET
jgi:hypothetical protein